MTIHMETATLSTTSESLGKDRVKLTVTVPEAALAPALEGAYRRWAGQMKVPGFRKGRVPRQIIDARVGADAVREEALRDALPDLYREALKAEDLVAIAPPEIEVVEFDAGAPMVFEATVELRPDIKLPELSTLEIEGPSEEVTDSDVDEQLDRLRDRFAELETIGREARRGDFALIDLKGYRHDQPVEGAGRPDFLYEIGSRSGPPKLDAELEGARPGVILKFNDVAPATAEEADEEISYTVLVKEIKAKKLPKADDDFAKTVGEYEKLEDLKADLRQRLGEVKKELVKEERRSLALQALVDRVALEPPEKLVEGEFDHRLGHLEDDLKSAGLTMADYGQQTQTTELEIRSELRKQAERAVAAELLLEEIARRQKVDVTEEDIGREIALAAAQAGRDPKEVAEQVVESGRLSAIATDIMRRKALDYVLENVKVVDRPVDHE
jgi:trigger factor